MAIATLDVHVSDVYILINASNSSSGKEKVGRELKSMGFEVRSTFSLNNPIDFIIFFNAKDITLSALHSQIHRICDVTNVVILHAFPV